MSSAYEGHLMNATPCLVYLGPQSQQQLADFERRMRQAFPDTSLELSTRPALTSASLATLVLTRIPDLLILDSKIEGLDLGNAQLRDFVHALKERDAELPILILGSRLEPGEKILEWMDLGVSGFLNPSFELSQLSDALGELLSKRFNKASSPSSMESAK
jgi:DNA-binding NarL/FixJ family response regulator